MIGRTIGRYRITKLLGKGGMGEVWKADDTLLGRPVALKFLPEDADQEDRDRFLRGLRAAAVLTHPGIAQVHEVGDDAGRPYAVLAFVDGRTVSEMLKDGPATVGDAVRITIAASEALADAHENGVVHRDVKSGNIMVARLDRRVFVVDFGLAWRKGGQKISRTGTILGTEAYMAPEVVLSHPADPRSDLYSLGTVLYELLTGTTPFGGLPHAAWQTQLIHVPPIPPSHHRAGLPEALEALVLKSLDKDPDRRFQSGHEFAAALIEIGQGVGRVPQGEPTKTGSQAPAARLPDHKFVAVHPFQASGEASGVGGNLSFIAAGLAEALSVGLGRLESVRVFPPASLGNDEAPTDPAASAARTGANLAVTGTVRRDGGDLIVRWWLIRPATGLQLAADTLKGAVVATDELEERLVADVAHALGLGNNSKVRTRTMARDPAAHDRFLQALGHLRQHENEASVDGAISILERLIAADEGAASYHAALGRALMFKHRITFNTRWLNRAAVACRKALELEPDAPDAMLTLGEIRNATGQHVEAEDACRKVLAARPNDVDAWIALSRSLESQRRLAEAEHAARQAVALRADHWPAYNRLGVLFFNQSRYDLAVEAWREVTRLAPTNARGWYNLGAAYFRSDRFPEALDAYHRSIDIGPSARAYTGEGTVLFYSGRIEEAVQRFEKARALTPEDPVAWGDLGTALIRLSGREAEAHAHLERAVAMMRQRVETNPGDADGFALLGNWLAHLGRLPEARKWIEHARTLDPDDGAQMIRMAFVAALEGGREEALDWLRAARKRGYGEVAVRTDPVLGPLVAELDKGRASGGDGAAKGIPLDEAQYDPGGGR